jgi:hypothetical protein
MNAARNDEEDSMPPSTRRAPRPLSKFLKPEFFANRLARGLVAATAALAVAACAHATKAPVYTFTASPTTPTPQSPAFQTYPIAAAFAKNGPSLTTAQREWVLRILGSRTFRAQRARLRFWIPPCCRPSQLIVYAQRPPVDGNDRGGHIIGEGCNAYFDPYEHGPRPMTGAGCGTFTPDPI